MSKKRFHQPREQLKIAGTERPDPIPELTALAEQWRELDEQGKGIKEAKDEVADQLVTEMQQRGTERHVYEDRYGQLQEITIAELTVKVQIKKLVKPHRQADNDAGSN
jgi:hypothetical protein